MMSCRRRRARLPLSQRFYAIGRGILKWPKVGEFGWPSGKLAEVAKEEFVARFEGELPSATACFLDDFDACIAHLQLPIAHRSATRLERLFGEERRRTKVISHTFGERAVLKLMYAALLRASQGWRRLVISEFELRQLIQLREELNRRHDARHAPAVSQASHSKFSSKGRT